MPSIRTAARALILHKDKLLTIKVRDRSGAFYILPGGGQRSGETLRECLQRECLEEIGAKVRVGELLYSREYIGKNHQFHYAHRHFHQLEIVFCCRLLDPETVGQGTEEDKRQIGIEWIPVNDLENWRLLPNVIKPFFKNGSFKPDSVYLGDTN